MAVASSVAETTVRSAAAGDEAAFARLIVQHNASMARVAYVIIGEREATLDAVQAAWTIAWRKLGSLRDAQQVGPWLIAIAANEARLHRRRERRANLVDISQAFGQSGAADPGESASLVDLQRALRRVSPDDRRLLALRFVAGYDSTEIARLLGLSASGVRSRLARLIEHLRTDLNEENE